MCKKKPDCFSFIQCIFNVLYVYWRKDLFQVQSEALSKCKKLNFTSLIILSEVNLFFLYSCVFSDLIQFSSGWNAIIFGTLWGKKVFIHSVTNLYFHFLLHLFPSTLRPAPPHTGLLSPLVCWYQDAAPGQAECLPAALCSRRRVPSRSPSPTA